MPGAQGGAGARLRFAPFHLPGSGGETLALSPPLKFLPALLFLAKPLQLRYLSTPVKALCKPRTAHQEPRHRSQKEASRAGKLSIAPAVFIPFSSSFIYLLFPSFFSLLQALAELAEGVVLAPEGRAKSLLGST